MSNDDTAERQDATLERRDALPAWIRHRLNGAVRQYRHNNDNSPSLSNPEKGLVFAYDCGAVETLIHRILHALSRTSDEGTGCVAPEAVEALESLAHAAWAGGGMTAEDLNPLARAVHRAIAEQGGQRVPKEAVGYAAIGDDGNVKGLWVLRDWDHAEAFADSCGCSLAPVFFGPQGNALAAAPQPEHGECDEL